MARLLLSTNTAWNLVNFRLGVIRALRRDGHEIICAAPPDEHVTSILAEGCEFRPMAMDNQGTSPVRDLDLLRRYRALMQAESIDACLTWTPKPNIYGALAARSLGRPAILNVSGLGVAFNRSAALRSIVLGLYRLAIGSAAHVYFQNEDNRAAFQAHGLLRNTPVETLPGSGVDVGHFDPARFPARTDNEPRAFIMVCRMLWDKGVGEYVEVARRARDAGLGWEFHLLGKLDVANPSAITRPVLDEWVAEGAIRYLGAVSDVRPHLARADCVVLPSYYPEGTPRSLLEGLAMARPIITTDMPGCRDTVDPGINGHLCAARDAGELFEAVKRICNLADDQRVAMGEVGRRKALDQFDEALVAERYVQQVRKVLGASGGADRARRAGLGA